MSVIGFMHFNTDESQQLPSAYNVLYALHISLLRKILSSAIRAEKKLDVLCIKTKCLKNRYLFVTKTNKM